MSKEKMLTFVPFIITGVILGVIAENERKRSEKETERLMKMTEEIFLGAKRDMKTQAQKEWDEAMKKNDEWNEEVSEKLKNNWAKLQQQMDDLNN